MTSDAASEAFLLLRSIDVLVSMPDETLRDVASVMSPVSIEKGDVLVRLGEVADALFVIAEGELEVRLPSLEGEVVVATLGRGRGIGEMQMVSGGTRTATLVALCPTRLYRLARPDFARFASFSPAALAAVVERVRQRTQEAQIASLLPVVVAGLDAAALDALRSRVAWIELRRGERLFAQGDVGDAWYIVASGRLEIVIADAEGRERTVGEASRGDSLGELSLLTEEPRAATVWAIRDTALLRIGRLDFDQVVVNQPAVMLNIVRSLGRRLAEQTRAKPPRGFGQRFAVVGARPDVPTAEVARRLADGFAKLGATLLVNPTRLAALGVMDNAATIDDNHPAWIRFVAWLDEQDLHYDHVVLEGGPDGQAWTQRAVRQADHVLLVATASADPSPTPAEVALDEATRPRGARRTLILLHPDGSRRPSGTARWLDCRVIDGHQHVRMDRDGDFGRVARLLAGKAVGLALGGGGARGFAHIGVIRALTEAGVPVDMVGGTSMGSIIAGMHAMGLGHDEMVTLNESLIRLKPFVEFTLPIIAMLRTRRIERTAKMAFGEIAIEDLWINYFCVSASLTSAQMVVHERGPVWEATRASGALPGVAVPMLLSAGLLIDGGVVNNLPGDIMRTRCRGDVIVVNVSPDEDRSFALDRIPGPWEVLWSWINPFRTSMSVPTVLHIIMRTATLASADRARAVERDADLYLRPPIDNFGLLDFDRIREIVDVGYRYAVGVLSLWRKPPPPS